MRVITYADPRHLAAHPSWDLIRRTTHLCATRSLADGVRAFYQDEKAPKRYLAAPVVPINQLFAEMLSGWTADLTEVRQYSEITHALQWLRGQKKVAGWGSRLEAFERNQQALLRTVRTLAEGGLKAKDLPARTPDEELFRQLLGRLEQKDGALRQLEKDLYGQLDEPDRFRTRLRKALAKLAGQEQTIPPLKRLVAHGFYFITPLQQRMMDLMENAGIDLIFLNCYDPRHERVFETWEAFFSDKDSWEIPAPKAPAPPVAVHFARLMDGNASGTLPGSKEIPLVRYPDTSALLDEIRFLKSRGKLPALYSPLAADLNGLLRDFYPDQYARRHFLAYPAGRFLYELHTMWHERSGELRLTPDGLMECLSSGLLQDGKLHGQDYTLTLRRVMPVLEGLDGPQSQEAWLKRLDWLIAALKGASGWETTADAGDPHYAAHAMLANPFRRIGYTSIQIAEAKALRSLVRRLFAIARELFAASDVPIYDHLQRIHDLVSAGVDQTRLLDEEQELLAKLQQHLDNARDDGTALPRRDLAAALQFFLGGVTKEDDEELVGGLDRLDGAVLTHAAGALHLCLLTDGALPARGRKLPWPLTEQSLEQIRLTHRCADLLLKRQEQAANASLYLFYYALAYGSRVTLSWVAEWQGEPVEESLYLLLLQDAGMKHADAEAMDWAGAEGPADLPPPHKGRKGVPASALTRHAAAEYLLCPLRWFYSYGPSPGPVYESPFHHQFLFSALVQRLMQPSPEARNMRNPRAVARASEFFPHLTDARKRDCAERYARRYWQETDEVGDEEYNEVYRKFMVAGIGKNRLGSALNVFLKDRVYTAALAKMKEAGSGSLPEPDPGPHCRFCPHTGHCPSARFAMDDER